MEGPFDWDLRTMLDMYIYDYMLRRNLHKSAKEFAEEGNVPGHPFEPIDSPSGFLVEWWSIFSDMYSRRQSQFGTQNIMTQSSLVMEHGSSSTSSSREVQKLQSTCPFSTSGGLPSNLDEGLISLLNNVHKRPQFSIPTDPFNECVLDARLQSPLELGKRKRKLPAPRSGYKDNSKDDATSMKEGLVMVKTEHLPSIQHVVGENDDKPSDVGEQDTSKGSIVNEGSKMEKTESSSLKIINDTISGLEEKAVSDICKNESSACTEALAEENTEESASDTPGKDMQVD